MTSPDLTVWGASITTSGVISFTSGAAAGDTAVIGSLSGLAWTPAISNGGVVSATSGSALSASDTAASIADSAGTVWTLYVNDNNEICVTSSSVAPGLVRYPALRVSYTPASATDVFLVHSARLNLTIRRQSS